MKTTKIEWTEQTWNPSVGCTKVSAGCKNCYAETMAARLQAMGVKGYEKGFAFNILPERLAQPLNNKKTTKYFVNSMSDLFHEDMPFAYLDKIFAVIAKTPQHTYQILTKREKIMAGYFAGRQVPANVWLGVTAENRKALPRIDYLRQVPASIRFVSMEPLLEDLGTLDLEGIHWVIVGGESGQRARPMKAEWVLRIREQCEAQGAAFFFKQWGAWGADGIKRSKKKNGRMLNGRVYDGYPQMAAGVQL